MTITSLATSTVSWMVTHPGIDQAHVCLTSVIGPWMVAPCQRGSLESLPFGRVEGSTGLEILSSSSSVKSSGHLDIMHTSFNTVIKQISTQAN